MSRLGSSCTVIGEALESHCWCSWHALGCSNALKLTSGTSFGLVLGSLCYPIDCCFLDSHRMSVARELHANDMNCTPLFIVCTYVIATIIYDQEQSAQHGIRDACEELAYSPSCQQWD